MTRRAINTTRWAANFEGPKAPDFPVMGEDLGIALLRKGHSLRRERAASGVAVTDQISEYCRRAGG